MNPEPEVEGEGTTLTLEQALAIRRAGGPGTMLPPRERERPRPKPRRGQQVQVHCDGRDLVGKIVMEVTEPSVILQSSSGALFVVPLKGSTFQGDSDEIPLGEPPDEG